MNQVNRPDDEIISLSGINLIYLGATTYGIIRGHSYSTPTPEAQPNTAKKTPVHSSKHTKQSLHAEATLMAVKLV